MSENMKTERKSLFELGEEYEKHINVQKSFIENCKNEIKKAKESGDFDAVKILEKKLYAFYEIKRELEETALKLKTYYGGQYDKSKNHKY